MNKNKLLNKYIIGLLIVCGIAFLIYQGTRQEPTLPAEFETEEVTSNVNTWSNIKPGETLIKDVESTFGVLQHKAFIGDGLYKHEYLWRKDTPDINVYTDLRNRVVHMEIPTIHRDMSKGDLDIYIKNFSLSEKPTEVYRQEEATNGLQVDGNPMTFKINVYPKTGIALEYNKYRREVHSVWYFVPVENFEEFLVKWGDKLNIVEAAPIDKKYESAN